MVIKFILYLMFSIYSKVFVIISLILVFKRTIKFFHTQTIKNTYDLDKLRKKTNSPSKITDAHIHPTSFQKMREKLAAQVLSHSMLSDIRTCAETGQLCSKTAIVIADFIEFINNLFDCLNSRSLYSNIPYNSALTHSEIVKTFLINASKYLINLKKIKKGKIPQPPCFKGFTQTINVILQFFEEEKCNDIFFF
ncbi:Transposable element P transposase [Aphis craccivora]|uniref:Transposable element P transposase n=1 Tax=Aphis craccivora TaxID=307492 RepID=A0A6G0Y4G3_APHCR|nr:Transposable element P transposase [Aphis craccivora]